MENKNIIDGVEIINEITFAEFKRAASFDKSLQITFAPLYNNERLYLKGGAKKIVDFFIIGYMYIPLIVIPLLSYYFNDWYMLFGLFFSSIAIYFGLKKKNLFAIPLMFMMWYWYKNGFHLNDYINFFWLCGTWGNFLSYMAVELEIDYAKNEIINNEDLFNKLIEDKIIFVMRKVN